MFQAINFITDSDGGSRYTIYCATDQISEHTPVILNGGEMYSQLVEGVVFLS